MIALTVVSGALIGVILGALGGGGSILTVPVLVYLLGQNAHGATTASLVVVGATALTGALAHWKRGRVRVMPGLIFGTAGIGGAVVGSWLSSGISSSTLLAAFSVVMVVAALAMLRRTLRPAAHSGGTQESGLSGDGSTTDASGPQRTRPVMLVLTASAVGLLTGFFGVGGGFVIVPALVLVMGFEMPVAIGTSLLVIVINSGAALVARVGTPIHVNWLLVSVLTLAAIGTSVLGSKLLNVIAPLRLTYGFTALLVTVGLYTLAQSVLVA